jgi:general secretion pathway protein L
MLNDFFSWWIRQLAELLPVWLRGSGDDGAVTIVSLREGVPLQGGAAPEIAISVLGRRGEGELCRVKLDEAGAVEARAALAGKRRPARVVLRLPEAALLEREVVLPLAAERDPEAVLGYDMDRLTPFRASDVVWRASELKRDRAGNRLSLRLSLVPRSFFAAAVTSLARIGLKPDAVEASAPGGGWRRLPLNAPGNAKRTTMWGLRLAAGSIAMLMLIAVGLPFARQSLAERAVAAQIATLRPRVAEALALRQRAVSDAGGADAFADLAASVGNPLAVLAALTVTLPDDTYLESLSLSQRRLVMTGRSAAAARLIGLLAADPLVRTPAFAAAVTRAPTGGDEFAIRAEVGP